MAEEDSATKLDAIKPRMKRTGRWLLRMVVWLAVPFASLALPQYLIDERASFDTFYQHHLNYLLISAIPVLVCLAYVFVNHHRTHPPRTKSGKPKRPPLPPLPSLRQVLRDATDLLANLDPIVARVIWTTGFVATLWVVIANSVTVDKLRHLDQAVEGNGLASMLIGTLTPILYYTVLYTRVKWVMRRRHTAIDSIYAVARDTLGYPKALPRNATHMQRMLMNPRQAINVKKWRGLYDVDEFFVSAPDELSVDDMEKWDSFDVNLNAKVPREEAWRVNRDSRGRGAVVCAANYPATVLWDGEYDPDPFTFLIGTNLEDSTTQRFTFGEVSPHAALSGGTSSGKTSLAEVIAAQSLVKPMPWDPDLYGRVHIVDPKGPFARRWQGRPGVVVSNGQEDHNESDVDGDAITGPMVMALHMQHIEEEHQRRQSILAKYPDCGTWVELPDEVKRQEQLAPMFVILDEYIDHTDLEAANGDERIEKENAARATITRLAGWHARKYRNVGMHMILIAQEVKMTGKTGISSALMRNLPARAVTGQMDDTQIKTMFGTTEVPSLPATRVVFENGERKVKTIPGRSRIMNALGQAIHKVQVMGFGGPTNSETLDKWLPRGHAPPNGDFSLPTPREQDEATSDTTPPEPLDEAELVASTTPTTVEDGEVYPDHTETSVAPARPVEDPNVEPDTIFPSASKTTPGCSDVECVNDAARACAGCEGLHCEYHLSPSPDPAEQDLYCESCVSSHALTASGGAEVYRAMFSQAKRTNLVPHVTVKGPDSVVGTVVTPRNTKVVELHAQAGAITLRSRSGAVEGNQAALERVTTVINHYTRQQAAREREQREVS